MAHPATRVHEPIALSALLAAAASLHALWILNLLAARVPGFAAALDVFRPLGPVSGLYVASFAVYVAVFGGASLWLRGRDCSGVRDVAFWFFLSSVGAFALLTLPFVTGFGAHIRAM